MRAAVWLVVALAGCLRSTQFRCEEDRDCGANGTCQANQACSFFDASCDSEQRFDPSAGSLANTCVPPGGVPPVDAGVDARVDSAIDAPPGTCPSSYTTIPNGQAGRRYRLIAGAETWNAQRVDCNNDGNSNTYLAVPQTAPELAAIVQLNGGNKVWLGLDDRNSSGTWVADDGTTPTFLPWKPGSPETGKEDEQDCVAADSQAEIIDDECDQEYAAVCECED